MRGSTRVRSSECATIRLDEDSDAEVTRNLLWVGILSLLASGLFALTMTPQWCYWLFDDSDKKESAESEKNILYRAYGTTLALALKHRTYVVIGTLVVFAVSMWGFQFVKSGFFTGSTTPQMVVDYWLPQGTDIETTLADIKEIETFVRAQDGVQ